MKLSLSLVLLIVPTLLAQAPTNTLSVSNGMRQFTNLLLQDLEATSPSNFVFSPYSLHSVFTQLLLGSEGRTRSELETLLGVPASNTTTNKYSLITSGLKSGTSKLNVANHLAVAKGFKPKQRFRSLLNSGFSSDIKEYDFGVNKEKSVQQVCYQDIVNQHLKCPSRSMTSLRKEQMERLRIFCLKRMLMSSHSWCSSMQFISKVCTFLSNHQINRLKYCSGLEAGI